ncbi:filamentous hemagglutinin, partial [Pseudomonas sp. KFB-139]|nr:filamentous hemagglutinin [Pseudomonas sp. KFB-138]
AVTVNANAVEVNGPLYAGSSLSITTPGDLAIQQNIAARDSVTLSSTGHLSNSAIIEAGVNADNSRNAAGDVVLSAGNLTNTGNIVASRAVQATVTQTLNNQGGEILSDAALTLTSGRLDNSLSGRIAGKGVTVTTGAFNNSQDGRLTSTEALRLTAAQVNNSEAGRIASAMALTMVVTGLDLSTAILNNNQGVIRSESTLTLNAGAVSNTAGSLTSAGTSSLTVTDAVVNQGGEILSDAALTLTSGRLDNSRSGRIAGKGVTVTTGAFNNSQDGRLTSTEALRLTAAQVNNSEAGRIASAMALTAVVTGLDQHADGRLYSNGDVSLDLNNGHLNNQDGLITAPGQLLLTNLGTVNNQSGEISSAKGFTLAATSLDNTDGSVLSDESLIVRIDQVLTNLRGRVSATGLELSAATLNNQQGVLRSDSILTLNAGSVSNLAGSLTSTGTANLTVTDAVVNQGGEIL